MSPAILRRERVYSGHVTVERLLLRFADGQETWREVERHGDAVAVLPLDPVRRCALAVRLPRAPVLSLGLTRSFLEACAGMVDPGDADDATTARREAMEELGLRLDALVLIGRVWTSPGVVAERVSLFLADYSAADRVGPGGGLAEEQERIEIVETPLAALAADADEGAIEDAKLLLLVQAARLRRPELFAI
ncbi:MAG TPA: NUDIX domain-containing protein [Caulobacteraceae bacterium]|jgi:nudix-type nucleoside diphosphatase (YffH/AdpP family)|nr:NUDIX domain-containing protein [Caulobacteraceae bacterium]